VEEKGALLAAIAERPDASKEPPLLLSGSGQPPIELGGARKKREGAKFLEVGSALPVSVRSNWQYSEERHTRVTRRQCIVNIVADVHRCLGIALSQYLQQSFRMRPACRA